MGRNCSGANDIRQLGDYYTGIVDPLFYGSEDCYLDCYLDCFVGCFVECFGKSLNTSIMNCIGSLLFHMNSYHNSLKSQAAIAYR